jgi:hypothetical protein
MTKFTSGPDARRNRSGRPPSAAGLAAKILKTIGPNIDDFCAHSLPVALTGDLAAISICVSLLSAAIHFESKA